MSALLVKLARSLYEHNNSFGSAAFIETGALPLVLLHSPFFHHGPKLRAAEKSESTQFSANRADFRSVI